MRWVPHLLRFVPKLNPDAKYFEPFLGGASMFLALKPPTAILSDLNADLIKSFRFVQRSPDLVATYLRRHMARHSSDYYYTVRSQFNTSRHSSAAQAARFIYLNRTCFNGIYRVNLAGEFNVPYGKAADAAFPTKEHLLEVGAALKTAELLVASFEEALATASSGDFVYLDPPYPPLNGTSYFTHYTPLRFGEKDQKKLREEVGRLQSAGCRVMISNADTQLIRDLYSDLNIYDLRVTRYVTSSHRKHAVGEVVITTYQLDP